MQLMAGHAIAAKVLRAPELMLSMDEAKSLAKAIKKILALYPVNISPKAMAFYQLMAAASMIYVPRLLMITARKSKEAATKKQQRPTGGLPPNPSAVPGAFDPPPAETGSMRFN